MPTNRHSHGEAVVDHGEIPYPHSWCYRQRANWFPRHIQAVPLWQVQTSPRPNHETSVSVVLANCNHSHCCLDSIQPAVLERCRTIGYATPPESCQARLSLTTVPEYKTHFLTKIFGSPYRGCYFLALTIFSLGIFRDYLYTEALAEQPFYPPLHHPSVGIALLVIGNVLVLTSMWALGVTGTYLGDYFGILMDEKVEGFPFNVTGAPMYWGSTCSFLGTALYKGKVAGVLLSVEIFFAYLIALQFEEYDLIPTTSQPYMLTSRIVLSQQKSTPSANESEPQRASRARRKLEGQMHLLQQTSILHRILASETSKITP